MDSPVKTDLFQNLQFDNRFIGELPADPNTENRRRQVLGACYSKVLPKPTSNPSLIAYAQEVAEMLGLPGQLDEMQVNDFAKVFTGNRVLAGMEPYATCYGGHQFGNWAGQLGDGRAINLGEIVNAEGQRWALQLKGAGPTPYSRTADGLAVLRSSIREFLCSEAMHHLGVPTTRALSLSLTGDLVERDMFYDGHPKLEPGAVVCRVAPSFIRFGNFQLFTSRGDTDLTRKLVEYSIRTDFPHLGEPGPKTYQAWFDDVCKSTADMIVHWMRVGFVHGVMNTDNMSILGLTIDYGPYGWLENYDPDWTPNTTDAGGRRYRYGHQPQIAHWNLLQLANAISPLFDSVEGLEASLEGYASRFQEQYQNMMAEKLGLDSFNPDTDGELMGELNLLLQSVETDMTLFYRLLADFDPADASLLESDNPKLISPLKEAYYQPEQLTEEYLTKAGDWLKNYLRRSQHNKSSAEQRRARMNRVNPKYVLRNYLAQVAIDKAEQGDHSMIGELLDLLRNPYDEQPGKEGFAAKRPEWARERAGCSMLSCSS